MERYLKAFSGGYTGYFTYLVNEILHPGWHNYFYWLVGLSASIWLLEIVFPWRKDQPVFRQEAGFDCTWS